MCFTFKQRQIAPLFLFRMNINYIFFLFSKPNKHKHFKNKLKIIVKKYCSY